MTTTTTTRPARAATARPHTTDRWLYLDGPLAAFVIIMVAAATITSHGTFLFFSYILPSVLAGAATIVLTMGIPLLELAAVLDKANRWRYLLGLLFLLFIEGLAQYFQGQAVFVAQVARHYPDAAGIDLATFAAEPRGRILPILYLASLSGVVVYFGYAASARIRDLRSARGLVAARDEALAGLQREVAEWSRLAEERAGVVAELQDQLAATQGSARGVVEKTEGVVAELQRKLAAKDREVAQAQASARGLIAPTYPAFVEYLRGLAGEGKSPEVIAATVQASPSTVRGWLKKAEA
jgi:hypothetical protein